MIEPIVIGCEGRHTFTHSLSPPVKGASTMSARVGSGSLTSSRGRRGCALVAAVTRSCPHSGSDCGHVGENSTLVAGGTGTLVGVVQQGLEEGAILPRPWKKIMSHPLLYSLL